MKYNPDQQTVSAVYDHSGSKNPLIEALPEPVSAAEFEKRIGSFPPVPIECSDLTFSVRMQRMAQLQTVFVPLDYMYFVYDTLYRMMKSTYYTRSSKENVTRINAFFTQGADMSVYGTQPQTGALLGTAGVGKTTTIRKCLSLIPQVIAHEKYLDTPFFCKQVLWLFCECPSDASAKTMSYNIVKALDQAVGSNHLDYLLRMRSTASSAVATYIKVLCLTYHVGLIVVDEIQNLVVQAQKNNRIRPLIRFLTELTNDSATAIYLSGTTLAESVFLAEEYLRRRTRGPRLLPFKPDGVYRDFLQQLWPYQYTERKAVLTDKLANQIYDYSGGIPAYITKIFEQAQMMAMMDAAERIDGRYIQSAVDYLAIKPPREYEQGSFLSDFKVGVPRCAEDKETMAAPHSTGQSTSKEKRLYANPRGRKAKERDERDMLFGFRTGTLHELLLKYEMLEEIVLC